MTPWLNDGDVALYHGGALDVLRSLPAGSVQTCVTSPPYWGLRDYGTGSWTGGSAECDHTPPKQPDCKFKNSRGEGADGDKYAGSNLLAWTSRDGTTYRDECPRCGAQRVDAQLGLEATPNEYVAALVAVFAEVWRVLRDDGTLWLNLAGSFASAGTAASQSRRSSRAPAYDTDGTEQQGLPDPGSACLDLCDGCRAAIPFHLHRNADNDQPLSPSVSVAARTDRGTSTPGSVAASLAASHLDARASTSQRSSLLPLGECSHCSNCGACLSVLRSSSRDADLCARTAGRTAGMSAMSPSSAARNGDTESSGSAWLKYTSRLKPKDMVPTPWMVAMALQEWGWYLRSDIVWFKSNPMPESVVDRPTKAHEYVFLLAKQPKYFFDADAIRESQQQTSIEREARARITPYAAPGQSPQRRARPKVDASRNDAADDMAKFTNPAGRNARSVWEIATQPTPEAHFATFPEALVRRCILAGSSEAGGCSVCGAPWQRVVDRTPMEIDRSERTHDRGHTRSSGTMTKPPTATTTGWAASCACGAPPVPQQVLDPFVGSGTTALVARKHGRRAIGVDLSADYLAIAARRLGQQSLFATGEGAA